MAALEREMLKMIRMRFRLSKNSSLVQLEDMTKYISTSDMLKSSCLGRPHRMVGF